jgi:hypothetical protein
MWSKLFTARSSGLCERPHPPRNHRKTLLEVVGSVGDKAADALLDALVEPTGTKTS